MVVANNGAATDAVVVVVPVLYLSQELLQLAPLPRPPPPLSRPPGEWLMMIWTSSIFHSPRLTRTRAERTQMPCRASGEPNKSRLVWLHSNFHLFIQPFIQWTV